MQDSTRNGASRDPPFVCVAGLCFRSQFAAPMLCKTGDLNTLRVSEVTTVREPALIRTFSFGVVLGVAAAAALVYFIPVVDQGRERSIITVQANGGNREAFHVNLPTDRIFAGRAGIESTVPEGVEWPDSVNLADTQAELFKVRNAEERVIGVASRIAAVGDQPFVEWALHMPARGTMYVMLDSTPTESGSRAGSLRAGTREFAELRGSVLERYVAGTADGDEASGRLELIAVVVGPDLPLDDEMDVGE